MMQATLTFDNTTINLMADGCVVEDGFRPATASARDESVGDELRLHFTGTNANARILNQNINKILDIARNQRGLRGIANPVAFNWAINGTDTLYRTIVGDGWTDLHEGIERYWKNGRAKFTLRLERAPFWEGPLTNVPVSNANGVRVINGLAIFPCADGEVSGGLTRQNYAKVLASDLSGDMAGAAQIELKQSKEEFGLVNPNPMSKLFIGNYVDLFSKGLLMDNFDAFYDAGSPTSQALASGGNYYVISLPIAEGTNIARVVYNDVSKLRGSWFRFFLRSYGAAPDGTWVRVRAKLNYTIYVGETPWVRLDTAGEGAGNTRTYDLGMMRMPPYLYAATNPLLTLFIEAWKTGGGTLNLDALQMFGVDYYAEVGTGDKAIGVDFTVTVPPSSDQWIYIREGFGTLDRSIVEYNYGGYPNEGQIFTQRVGGGIYLTPGKDNYLHFNMRAPDTSVSHNGTARDDYSLLSLAYRPRRRNI